MAASLTGISRFGLLHMTDQNDCSCPDRRYRKLTCCHMRAVRFWMAAFKTGAVSPKRETASLLEDRIALTPKGAQYLVDLAAESPPVIVATAADVIEPVAEHPFISELRARLERETCAEARQSIEAKIHDTQARIASVAASKRASDAHTAALATTRMKMSLTELMDRHLVEA